MQNASAATATASTPPATSKPRRAAGAARPCSQTIPAAASSGKQKIVTTTNLIGNRVNPSGGRQRFQNFKDKAGIAHRAKHAAHSQQTQKEPSWRCGLSGRQRRQQQRQDARVIGSRPFLTRLHKDTGDTEPLMRKSGTRKLAAPHAGIAQVLSPAAVVRSPCASKSSHGKKLRRAQGRDERGHRRPAAPTRARTFLFAASLRPQRLQARSAM